MCLGVKIYNFVSKGKKAGIDNIELFTACEKMLKNIIDALHMQSDNQNIKRSKNPIFEGIKCPKTRALLAIGLGCDVYQSGVRGVMKVVLKQWLDNNKNIYKETVTLHAQLVDFFAIRSSCDNICTKK